MTELLLISNAAAGSADDATVAGALAVLRTGAHVEHVQTHGPEQLRAAVANRRERTVVVAGGDGSLHALIQVLDELGGLADQPTVGLLPLGTGNDFSRTLGLPSDVRDAATTVLAGNTTPVDVIRDDTGEAVINVAHIGVGAEAGERARPWKARFGRVGLGVLGYAVGAVEALVATDGYRLAVTADGRPVTTGRRRVLQVAVANGRTIGGGAEIAPDADPGDGLIDLSVSFAAAPLARLAYGLAMRTGRHTDRDDVVRLRVREVTVVARRGTFTVNSDGELSGPVRRRSWRIEPGAYRILVPSIEPDRTE
ncbi:MAG TPA: YegS/Rv2252/BmrU family lipid kinase [Actinomycetales bacterium]|nr:YegS/Rv2252/BmrU family lipid kinase [Actinomycetales bacterium]